VAIVSRTTVASWYFARSAPSLSANMGAPVGQDNLWSRMYRHTAILPAHDGVEPECSGRTAMPDRASHPRQTQNTAKMMLTQQMQLNVTQASLQMAPLALSQTFTSLSATALVMCTSFTTALIVLQSKKNAPDCCAGLDVSSQQPKRSGHMIQSSPPALSCCNDVEQLLNDFRY
jgi:hypothetical protein